MVYQCQAGCSPEARHRHFDAASVAFNAIAERRWLTSVQSSHYETAEASDFALDSLNVTGTFAYWRSGRWPSAALAPTRSMSRLGKDWTRLDDSSRKRGLRSLLRVVSALMDSPATEPAPDDSSQAESLDRRLAADQPDEFTDGLVRLRSSACAIHVPLASFNPKPDLENCRDLIGQIARAGGNTEPVLVRQIEAPPNVSYVVLVGARRLFAVDWLNRNGHPDMRVMARIVSISDEEAFLIARQENANREDISDLVRARGLRLAKDLFYGGVQARMAAALGVSRGHVSGIMALADLPDAIVSAFGRNEDLRSQHAELLAPLLRRELARAKMLEEAARIDREQQKLSSANLPLLPAQLVVTRLRSAGERSISASTSTASIWYRGEDVGSIWRNPDGIIQLGAAFPPGVPIEPLTKAIESALRSLR